MENIISKPIVQKVKSYVIGHKITSVIVLLAVIWGGYWGYGKLTSTSGETQYVLSAVTKGTVISSLTGTGQVSVSSQIDLKPSVSGTITYVGVKPGDQVSAGKTLFTIDNKDAQKALRDAQINLDSAKISLAKLKEPADTLSVIQYQNAIAQAQDAKKNQELVVKNALSSYLNSSIIARPTTTSAGGTIVTPPTISGTYNGTAEGIYYLTIQSTGGGANFTITGLENGNGIVSTTTPTALGTLGLYIQFPSNFSSSGVYYWTIEIPNKQATSYGSSYNSYQLALQNQAQVNTDSDRSIAQNTEALRKLQSGADVLDLQTAELTVKQKENALQDAKDNLSNYYISAPFDGTIASVPVNVDETASSGTILGTIITAKKLATVSLNEVDAAKVKLGQKTTLTFDAVPDLTIAGNVAEIDSVGTVSQGVVTYNVKIGFDSQDSRVKSGMSVSATIITDMAQDVIAVPNNAIKNKGGVNYVEMFDTALTGPVSNTLNFTTLLVPKEVQVETGLVNNISTEVTSGLKEGDVIVIKTIAGATAAKTSTPSILNAVGGGATGRGGPRLGN